MPWIVRKITTIQDQDTEIFGIHVDRDCNIYCALYHEGLYCVSKDSNVECLVKDETLGGSEMTGVKGRSHNLYGCDLSNHKIALYRFDTGAVSTVAGTGEEGHKDGNTKTAMFRFPATITMDDKDNLYVGEYYHVRKINLQEDTVTTIATLPCRQFGGLAVDKDGTIYGTDYQHHCIQRIQDRVLSIVAGEYGKEGHLDKTLKESLFSSPHGIAFHRDGSLIVTDKNGIRRLEVGANRVSTMVPHVNCLKDLLSLVIDHHGDIYVTTASTIYKLENSWTREKFLWLGHLKEDAGYCWLARLYPDLIRLIAAYLRVQDEPESMYNLNNKKRKYA